MKLLNKLEQFIHRLKMIQLLFSKRTDEYILINNTYKDGFTETKYSYNGNFTTAELSMLMKSVGNVIQYRDERVNQTCKTESKQKSIIEEANAIIRTY